MLKNRKERRKFIENEDNWKILDSYLEGLRVKELDLGDKVVNVIEVKTYVPYLKKERWVAESMRLFNKSKGCYEWCINTNELIDYLTEHKKDEVIKDFNNDLLEDCKSQYKNVGLGQYKNVGFPTFLYCLFSLHLL